MNNKIKFLKNNSLGSLLLKGASSAFLLNVASAGLAFGLQIYLARLLGARTYGDYIYVISWINLLTLFGKLGLDTASLRFLAEYRVQEKWDLFSGYLKRSSLLVFMFSVCLALAVIGVTSLYKASLGAVLYNVFLVAAILLPLYAILEVIGTYLRGLRYVVRAIAPRAVLHPLLFSMTVFIAFNIYGYDTSALMTVVINLLVTLVTIFVTALFLFKALPASIRNIQPKFLTKEWLAVSLPLFIISGLHLILIRSDVLMLGALRGTTEAGIYSAVSKVTELMLFGQNSVNFIFAPMISELHAKGDKIELQCIVKLASIGILAISIPVGLGLIFFGKFILSLFGSEFTGGLSPLLILIIGQIVIAFTGTAGWLLSMTGYQKENAKIIGFAAALNILLNLLLIPSFGLIGAAVATTVSTIISNILLVYIVWKRLQLVSVWVPFKTKVGK